MEETLFDKWRAYRFKHVPFTLIEIVDNLSNDERDQLIELGKNYPDMAEMQAFSKDKNNQETYDKIIVLAPEFLKAAQIILAPLAVRMARVLPPVEELDK